MPSYANWSEQTKKETTIPHRQWKEKKLVVERRKSIKTHIQLPIGGTIARTFCEKAVHIK